MKKNIEYYLEDLVLNQEFELGTVDFTKASIIDFAEKYDPQPFHLDEKIATSMFGGLIASGMHTCSLASRIMVEKFLSKAAGMASPGLDEIRFLKPVFAGDTLKGKLTILESKVSKSRPDRGMIKVFIEMKKAGGELALSMIGKIIIGCKPT